MASRMDLKDFCRSSWKAGLPVSWVQISLFLEYHAPLWLLDEDRGKRDSDDQRSGYLFLWGKVEGLQVT